jgi:hypothetical protein
LVGLRDGVAIAEHLVEQLALGAGPARDPLAQLPVESPEVGLDLAEVGEQPAGRVGELLVAVALSGRVEDAMLPRSTSAISTSISCLRHRNSASRTSGSSSAPYAICRSSSKSVFSRDSVPMNDRASSVRSHESAFSTAGVASKCGSSDPAG